MVKQDIDELEHPYLIAEGTSNMDEAAYKAQSEKIKNKPSEKYKSIITLAGTTFQRVLNKSYVVPISVCFDFYGQ